MRKTLIAAAVAAALMTNQVAAMECPDGFAEVILAPGMNPELRDQVRRPYFRCDYTSQTCERGVVENSPDRKRIFELLAGDRCPSSEILRH
jgi:hypothetical protein